jgi:hypothetical protein
MGGELVARLVGQVVGQGQASGMGGARSAPRLIGLYWVRRNHDKAVTHKPPGRGPGCGAPIGLP